MPTQDYRTADGVKQPSVTTILGRFKDSGGLIKWAYKQGREHENLAMRSLPAPRHLYDKVEEAALAGTIAHALIEANILDGGKEGERFAAVKEKYSGSTAVDVKLRAWNSYQQFLKWMANTRIRITHTEIPLVSEKHRFGGCLDALGLEAAPAYSPPLTDEGTVVDPDAIMVQPDGTIVLVDWKTSNAVYGDMLIQLAAYSLLLEECRPELAPKGYHLLRVAKESADFAHHYYGDLTREKQAFLLMRELYDHVYAIEKRA